MSDGPAANGAAAASDWKEKLRPRSWQIKWYMALPGLWLAGADMNIFAYQTLYITEQLGNTAVLPWIPIFFMLAQTVATPLGNALGKAYGQQQVLFVSNILFSAGLFICWRSQSWESLIGGRLLSGFGGAQMITTPYGIMGRGLKGDKAKEPLFLGLTLTMLSFGQAAGGALGAYLTVRLGWEAGFLVQAALASGVALLTLYTCWDTDYCGFHWDDRCKYNNMDAETERRKRLTEPHDITRRCVTLNSVDWLGAVLLGVCLCCLILTTNLWSQKFGTRTQKLGTLIGCIVTFFAFVAWDLVVAFVYQGSTKWQNDPRSITAKAIPCINACNRYTKLESQYPSATNVDDAEVRGPKLGNRGCMFPDNRQPVIAFHILRLQQSLSSSVFSTIFVQASISIATYYVPIYLQKQEGFDVLETAKWSWPLALASIVCGLGVAFNDYASFRLTDPKGSWLYVQGVRNFVRKSLGKLPVAAGDRERSSARRMEWCVVTSSACQIFFCVVLGIGALMAWPWEAIICLQALLVGANTVCITQLTNANNNVISQLLVSDAATAAAVAKQDLRVAGSTLRVLGLAVGPQIAAVAYGLRPPSGGGPAGSAGRGNFLVVFLFAGFSSLVGTIMLIGAFFLCPWYQARGQKAPSRDSHP